MRGLKAFVEISVKSLLCRKFILTKKICQDMLNIFHLLKGGDNVNDLQPTVGIRFKKGIFF